MSRQSHVAILAIVVMFAIGVAIASGHRSTNDPARLSWGTARMCANQAGNVGCFLAALSR